MAGFWGFPGLVLGLWCSALEQVGETIGDRHDFKENPTVRYMVPDFGSAPVTTATSISSPRRACRSPERMPAADVNSPAQTAREFSDSPT